VEKKRRSQVGDGKESAGGKKGRKNASKSQDDPLAVSPMFDDSDDDGFSGLVIDIPSIP
jgi:hypothetical protein